MQEHADDTYGMESGRLSPLSGRVIRGAGWMLFSKAAERGMTLAKIIVLARLLSPHDFGIFAIAVLAVSALEMLSQTGIRRALVQRPAITREHLDSAWTFLLLRELALFALLTAVAHPVSAFFQTPQAAPLLRAMAALTLLRGLHNIGTIYFERDLCFCRMFILEAGAAAAGLATAVVMAVLLRSAWALVLGSLTAEAVRTALSYTLHGYRPRPALEKRRLADLLHFGKWMFGGHAVGFIAGNLDNAVIGRIIGAAALGLYQVGFKISSIPLSEFGNTLFNVLFPAYARLQHDRKRLGAAFLTAFGNIMFAVIPAAAALTLYAPQIVRYTAGTDWMPVVPLIRLLAPAAALHVAASSADAVYLGAGRPDYSFLKNVLRLTLLGALMAALAPRRGNEGVSQAILLANLCMLPLSFLLLRRITAVSVLQAFRCTALPAAGAAVLVLPPLALEAAVPAPAPVAAAAAAAAGFIAFLLFVIATKGREIKSMVKLISA